jgi:hypothetical protein
MKTDVIIFTNTPTTARVGKFNTRKIRKKVQNKEQGTVCAKGGKPFF